MRINCPQCGQPIQAMVESIVDGGRDPAAKGRFLSRRTNLVQCPNCGAGIQLSVPLVYHDQTHELMVVYFPMELNMPPAERERIIGEMSRAVMNSLPQELRKGYLFKPVEALTLEGMIELVLQKDGVTPEMIANQKAKLSLVESFLRASDEALPALIAQYDADLDEEFFNLLTLSAENALAAGRQDAAQALLGRRNQILEGSSFGQELMLKVEAQERAVEEVAHKLQSFGEGANLDKFIEYLIEIRNEDNHLQAMVGLARGLFSYQFFERLAQIIEKQPAKIRPEIEAARGRVLELIDALDQQQQQMIQQVQMAIQQLMAAPNLEEAVRQNLEIFDENFLSILGAMLQASEQRGDLLQTARLRNLYDTVMSQIQSAAPPSLRLINDLLRAEDDLEARLLLSDNPDLVSPELLETMEALIEQVAARGNGPIVERLQTLRDTIAKMLKD